MSHSDCPAIIFHTLISCGVMHCHCVCYVTCSTNSHRFLMKHIVIVTVFLYFQ